jgi:RNA polymerase sigma-70 factor (ECF subfamily)
MTDNDEVRWAELMCRSQAGDALAYERLLTELADAIAGYVRYRFGRVSFAEDCVQDCLIAVHEARHTFAQGRLFRSWLFAIVRNRAIDLLRHQRVHAAVFSSDVGTAELDGVAAGSTEIEEQPADGAGTILSLLAPRHREVLMLTKVMGFTNAEAAERLGISTGAVKVRVHRATRAAVKALESERT